MIPIQLFRHHYSGQLMRRCMPIFHCFSKKSISTCSQLFLNRAGGMSHLVKKSQKPCLLLQHKAVFSTHSSSNSKLQLMVTSTSFSQSTPEKVWAIWSNPSTWSTWDHGLEWCKLKEGHLFEINHEALLKPHGAPEAITLRIVECTKNSGFADETTFEFGKLITSHKVVRHQNGVNITHTISFQAVNETAKQIFEKNIWPQISSGLSKSVSNLAHLASSPDAKKNVNET